MTVKKSNPDPRSGQRGPIKAAKATRCKPGKSRRSKQHKLMSAPMAPLRKLKMPIIVRDLNCHDVLLGRGNAVAQTIGNINFRRVVWGYKEEYRNAQNQSKSSIALKVLHHIASLSPPGRVLEKLSDGTYTEVSKRRAIEKACQALRELKNSKPLDYDTQMSRNLLGQVFAVPPQGYAVQRSNLNILPPLIKPRSLRVVTPTVTPPGSQPTCAGDFAIDEPTTFDLSVELDTFLNSLPNLTTTPSGMCAERHNRGPGEDVQQDYVQQDEDCSDLMPLWHAFTRTVTDDHCAGQTEAVPKPPMLEKEVSLTDIDVEPPSFRVQHSLMLERDYLPCPANQPTEKREFTNLDSLIARSKASSCPITEPNSSCSASANSGCMVATDSGTDSALDLDFPDCFSVGDISEGLEED